MKVEVLKSLHFFIQVRLHFRQCERISTIPDYSSPGTLFASSPHHISGRTEAAGMVLHLLRSSHSWCSLQGRWLTSASAKISTRFLYFMSPSLPWSNTFFLISSPDLSLWRSSQWHLHFSPPQLLIYPSGPSVLWADSLLSFCLGPKGSSARSLTSSSFTSLPHRTWAHLHLTRFVLALNFSQITWFVFFFVFFSLSSSLYSFLSLAFFHFLFLFLFLFTSLPLSSFSLPHSFPLFPFFFFSPSLFPSSLPPLSLCRYEIVLIIWFSQPRYPLCFSHFSTTSSHDLMWHLLQVLQEIQAHSN